MGVDSGVIDTLRTIIAHEWTPHRTFILDIPAQNVLQREKDGRPTARYEQMGHAFYERVRACFLTLARQEPHRCVVIDGLAEEESIAYTIQQDITKHFLNASPCPSL